MILLTMGNWQFLAFHVELDNATLATIGIESNDSAVAFYEEVCQNRVMLDI